MVGSSFPSAVAAYLFLAQNKDNIFAAVLSPSWIEWSFASLLLGEMRALSIKRISFLSKMLASSFKTDNKR